MKILSLSVNDELSSLKLRVHNDDVLVLAIFSKALYENGKFRELILNSARFLLEEAGEDEVLRNIKNLCEELNIRLSDD